MDEDWRENPYVVELVEFALRSVIRAHPEEEDEGNRLRLVMKALFGIAPPKGKPPSEDLSELLYMAKIYAKQRGNDYSFREDYSPFWKYEDEIDVKSNSELAREALKARLTADPEYPVHNLDEKVRTLVKKFERRRGALLILVVGWENDGATSSLSNAVQDLRMVMEMLKIPIETIATPNRVRKAPH